MHTEILNPNPACLKYSQSAEHEIVLTGDGQPQWQLPIECISWAVPPHIFSFLCSS